MNTDYHSRLRADFGCTLIVVQLTCFCRDPSKLSVLLLKLAALVAVYYFVVQFLLSEIRLHNSRDNRCKTCKLVKSDRIRL